MSVVRAPRTSIALVLSLTAAALGASPIFTTESAVAATTGSAPCTATYSGTAPTVSYDSTNKKCIILLDSAGTSTNWTPPTGLSKVAFRVTGSGGSAGTGAGPGSGGLGAEVTGMLTLAGGSVAMMVSANGGSGGGSNGGSGGGASSLKLAGVNQVVAGGGGGGGGGEKYAGFNTGGRGGNATWSAGPSGDGESGSGNTATASGPGYRGTAGTQTAPGTGGDKYTGSSATAGSPGFLNGSGGAGGAASYGGSGGGGGGGYTGGGGGGGASDNAAGGGGGGGGFSWAGGAYVSSTSAWQAAGVGQGSVEISYVQPDTAPTVTPNTATQSLSVTIPFTFGSPNLFSVSCQSSTGLSYTGSATSSPVTVSGANGTALPGNVSYKCSYTAYSSSAAYVNGNYTAYSPESAFVLLPGPPKNDVAPVLTASPSTPSLLPSKTAIGQALSSDVGTWTFPAGSTEVGSPTYQWYSAPTSSLSVANWSPISGATTNEYSPTVDLIGKYVRAGVTRTGTYGSGTNLSATAYSAVTQVIDVPGAVTLTATDAVGTPGQASVTFTVPTQNASNISKYQTSIDGGSWSDVSDSNITPTAGSAPKWTTGTTETLVIPSLTNGTAISLKVRAVNEAGNALDSAAVSITPLAQIGVAPTVAHGDGSATVTWTAPSGGGQTGYRVQVATTAAGTYSDAAGGCAPATTMATTQLTCTATLTNETTYYFKVAATNANGTGAYSAASSAVTPLSRDMSLSSLAALIKTTVGASPTNLTLRPGFSSGELTYSATVPANVGILQLVPTVTYSGEEIRFGGNVIPSGVTTSDIVLTSGLMTTTDLLVWSRDRVVHADSPFYQTYVVEVTRRAPNFTPFTSYVTNPASTAAPTPANYANAGVNGVTAANASAINTALIGRAATAVDSTVELQVIADGYANVLSYADSGTPTPTTADYSAIGLTQAASLTGTGPGAALDFMNSIVLAKTPCDVNTVTKLNALADGVVAVLATTVMVPPASASTLTVAQLTAMGVTGVTGGNLAAIISAISSTQNPAAVDTVAELQVIVDATIQGFVDGLKNYVGNPPAPTVQDYENAGVDDVDEDNLDAINAAIAGLPSGSKDSQAEIQAVVDAYNQILDRTLTGTSTTPITSGSVYNTIGATVAGGLSTSGLSLLDSVLTVKTPSEVSTPALIDALATVVAKVFANPNVMTIEDFETLGIVGVTADNLVTLQALVQSTNPGDKDTLAELQALVDRSNALNVITKYANGLGSAPTIFDYLAAGVYRTTAANLAAVNAEVVSVAGATLPAGTWTATTTNVQTVVDGIMATSIAIIGAYDGTNTEPVLATYSAAGVINVNTQNLAAINSAIAALTSGDTSSRADIQSVVDAYNAILAIGAGAPTAPSVSAATFAKLGITGVTAANLEAMIAAIKTAGVEGVDTQAELQALVTGQSTTTATKLQSILDYATNGTPTPTVEDFANAGLRGVTEANLQAVLDAILELNPSPSPWTQADIQGVIDSVTIIAVNEIANYPESGGTPNPETYENAGIPGVTPEIVNELNIVIDRIPHNDKDTRGELEAIVEAFIIITSNAQGGENNDSPFAIPTVEDYETIGVRLGPLANDPQGMALLNSVIRGLPYETVSSVDELNDIVNILTRLMRLVAGSEAEPPLTADDFATIGVTGVSASNLSQTLANLRAAGANGTFEPTLAFVQSMVPRPPAGAGGSGQSTFYLGPIDPQRTILPGSVSALLDGQPCEVVLSPLPGNMGVASTGPGFVVEWVMVDSAGRTMRIDAGNVLVGQPGGLLQITGEGYAPESPLRVYSLGRTFTQSSAESVLLGEFMTNRSGKLNVTVQIPLDMDLGPISLQINGITPAGAVRSVTLGALLRAPSQQQVTRAIVYFAPESARLSPIAIARLERTLADMPADADQVTVYVMSLDSDPRSRSVSTPRVLLEKRARVVARWLRRHMQPGVSVVTGVGVAPGRDRVAVTFAFDAPSHNRGQ